MEELSHLSRSRLVLLTSRGQQSVAVHRPVRMRVTDAANGFIWIPKFSALARRLDACPSVRVSPCDLRWRPTGSDQPATAVRDETQTIAGIFGIFASSVSCYRVRPCEEPTPWEQRVTIEALAEQ